MRVLRLVAVAATLTSLCFAQTPEEKTAKYFDSVRHQPGLLLAFLQQMPKGGDLHVHLNCVAFARLGG